MNRGIQIMSDASKDKNYSALNLEPFNPDFVLTVLVDIVNLKSVNQFPITLNVQGLLITGTMINGLEWIKKFESFLGDRSITSFSDALATFYDGSHAGRAGFIHLKDAHVFTAGGLIPSPDSLTPSLWRCRLEEVSSWMYGEFRA
jgi:hypothetical protein